MINQWDAEVNRLLSQWVSAYRMSEMGAEDAASVQHVKPWIKGVTERAAGANASEPSHAEATCLANQNTTTSYQLTHLQDKWDETDTQTQIHVYTSGGERKKSPS